MIKPIICYFPLQQCLLLNSDLICGPLSFQSSVFVFLHFQLNFDGTPFQSLRPQLLIVLVQ